MTTDEDVAARRADEAVARLRAELGDGDGGHDLDTIVDELVALRTELAQRRALVTRAGPPPRYHLPGEWQAPTHTPPPPSALDGPPTATREATR